MTFRMVLAPLLGLLVLAPPAGAAARDVGLRYVADEPGGIALAANSGERAGPAPAAAAERPAPRRVVDLRPTGTLQARLTALGFLARGGVDGRLGPRTVHAVLAFQKWAGLERDGAAGPATRAALAGAARPRPLTARGGGRRVEVLLDRQLALAIDADRVVRVIHVSTGAPATADAHGRLPRAGQAPRLVVA